MHGTYWHSGLAQVTCLLAALSATFDAPAAEAGGSKPNIVFIMADDLGCGDLGCYNKVSKVPTPNMDRLAADGIRFADAHTPSSVCTPTRYGVLTGRYCWRSRLKRGVLDGYSPCLIEPGRMTVASLLKERGYATACVGKWHLGLGDGKRTDYGKPLRPGPTTVGFDYFFGIPASLDMPPYVFIENDRPVEPASEQIHASEHRRKGGGGFWRKGDIAPGFKHADVLPTLTRKAIEYVETRAKESPGKPFFLYLPLTAPHTPWLPTEEFRGRSKAGYYGDFVAQVDASVGQVMAALDRLKLSDNTLLFVTSDNGAHWTPNDKKEFDHLANGPYRGQKADIWDGGHRVAFLARWPGRIKKGATSIQTICLTDLMATCAAVVGAELPEDAGEDSFSLLPALLGEDGGKPIREAVVHHSISGMFAIRQGPWKLALGRGSGGFSAPRTIKPKPGEPKGQLYDLTEDVAETRNLYQDRPEIVKRLAELLDRYKTQGRSRAAR
ncbi:MAG: arylsulfatase [Phycisphaerae bacterium]|nr:arylsulfatase [Phycisphaerae bacterium]